MVFGPRMRLALGEVLAIQARSTVDIPFANFTANSDCEDFGYLWPFYVAMWGSPSHMLF